MEVVSLQRAASRAAQVITRHRAFVNRAGATALIQSLTPTLPELPGLDLAARYVPGSQYGVGGDWYDLYRLPSGRIGIVIGDVMGHGLHAATVMGRLRSALRAYALEDDGSEGEDPARVVDKLDRKLQHFEPGHLATVLYATLDLATRTLRICSAGHLPPVLVHPVRRAEMLPIVVNPPIGVSRDLVRRSTEVRLDFGSLLCLYTDGMVERRTSDIDDELLRLRRALSVMPLPSAESACALAMAEMLGNREAQDDVSILTVLLTDSLAHAN
jgi:serine phosphatase RsbU (regulator of sigma subunit)